MDTHPISSSLLPFCHKLLASKSIHYSGKISLLGLGRQFCCACVSLLESGAVLPNGFCNGQNLYVAIRIVSPIPSIVKMSEAEAPSLAAPAVIKKSSLAGKQKKRSKINMMMKSPLIM